MKHFEGKNDVTKIFKAFQFRASKVTLISKLLFTGEGAPKCLEFKRSQKAGCRSARHGGGRSFELFNEITHFVDASNIYGSSLKTLDLLRHGIRGKVPSINDVTFFFFKIWSPSSLLTHQLPNSNKRKFCPLIKHDS